MKKIFLLMILALFTFSCEKSDNGIAPSNEKKPSWAGNGGNGGSPAPDPAPAYLPVIFAGDINIVDATTGGCTVINWDAQTNQNGYQIRILDNCYCSTVQNDSLMVAGEWHFMPYSNATTNQAYMGCLWEIGKNRNYDIRILWWTRVQGQWQPHISDVQNIYVD